ncbi:MAG: hypothetical protein A3B14_03040 [Candidatus Zambryskibacteria bacterium RIFCSPLOWO2_01_FULL_45_21]|uniref:Nucleoside 2-deoxyribosyltransferase n=1 Tax=Candidatus Zambryskibacteria bacterium RIFCSPLOWO2_01_FULL_45_21 TaxID=1802761 RepID=A0A1G2U1Z2_9BACT|nr:MAG: hypothetical protein A3B14_03040 [Candidatus Zambryskibacteria bacterium RIFCSPLOWO2_01_FULL_45_21]
MSEVKRVYIAASFEQKDTVKQAYELFTKHGYAITADWTLHKDIVSLPTKLEQEELAKQYAIEDTDGVSTAEVFILLLGNRKSTGAHIELGIALGAKIPYIFVVSDRLNNQLFYRHPSVKHLQTIEEILEILNLK